MTQPVQRTVFRKLGRRIKSYRRIATRAAPYFDGRRGAMAMGVLLSVAFTSMKLLEPWPLKLIVDNVLLGRALPSLLPAGWGSGDGFRTNLLLALVLGIVVISLVRGLCYYRRRLLLARVGIEITSELRLDLYRHLQHLSLNFHDRRSTGDLIVRLTSDIRMLRQAFVALPIELMEGFLLMTGMAVVMLVMDWRLALPALVLMPVVALLVRRYQKPMRRAIRKQREREGHLASLAAESLGAIRVVQGFRGEKREVKRFGGANRRDVRSGLKAARLEAKLKWSADLSVSMVTALIVLLSSRYIAQGSMSVGDLIVFVSYLRVFARPLQRVSRITERMSRAAASGERVLRILQTESRVKNLPQATAAPRFAGNVAFEDVTFGYNDRSLVLDGLDLEIKAGERVAIVGPTGTGKSTLISLIPRFYDPQRGTVKIDGRDVREFTLESLRKQVSMVFQEPVLFGTTIAENIAYGRPGADMDQIVRAARKARVDRIIERLPEGYDTVIGERGGTLSGGQRQCIAIARAMIRNAPILLMDELTTGLDPRSAARVMKALTRLMEGRTVLLITHDPRNLSGMDRLIYLEGGRIARESRPSDPESFLRADGGGIVTGTLRDEVFPGLAGALDPGEVRRRLHETLPECRDGLIVEEVKIFNVQYRPRKSCAILFRVKFRRGAGGRSVTQQMAGHLTPAGHEPQAPDVAHVRAYQALEGLPLRSPVVHLPRLAMVAYAYPFDPSLPGLVDASDPARVRQELSRMWGRRAARVRRVTIDSLGYTPGARAALHYEILSEDRKTRLPEVRHLVGKIDKQRDPAELFARSWAVWQASSQRIRLAAPVGYLPHLNLWLQERVDGVRLAELAGGGNLFSPLRQTAGFLAVLHELQLPLRSRRAATHHVKAVHRWGGMIAAIRPRDGRRVRDLRDRIAAQLEERARITGPIHGDLHPANLLVAGDRVTLVDLDNMSLGDRLLDIGRFMSALRTSSLRALGTLDGLADARESFLERYLSQTGEDERRARLFEAASLIISAGTGFRLQREGWDTTATLIIDEAERVLGLAGDSASTTVAAGDEPARSTALAGREGSARRHDWATDEQYMRALLDSHVRRRYDVEILSCSCERKAHGARRDRLRYNVSGLRGSERVRLSLDGILWHDNRGGRVSRRLQAVWETLEQQPDAPLLPRPVAYLRDAGIQLLELPQGTPFDECLAGDAGPRAAEALAKALSALHRSDATVERTRPMASELASLSSRIERLEGSAVGTEARRLFERVAPALSGAEEPAGLSLRHLSPRRLLLVGARIGLTEVDDLVLSHPLLDPADFLGRLALGRLNGSANAAPEALSNLFRKSFLSQWTGAARLAPFEAAALVRHACVEAGRAPDTPLAIRLLSAASERLELGGMEQAR